MITIAKRKKDKEDIVSDLRKKFPCAAESDLSKAAEEKLAKVFAKIRREHPGATIVDLTSKSKSYIGPTRAADNAADGLPAVMFSPFFAHGGIPIPGYDGLKATCVEAVWQGLKVFQGEGVDFATFANATGRNLKRTVRRFGVPLGHMYLNHLIGYLEARDRIYLPTYRYVLDNVASVHQMAIWLRNRLERGEDFVFLDYNTNGDYRDSSSPLSHASLVRDYVMGRYPGGGGFMPSLADADTAQATLFPNL